MTTMEPSGAPQLLGARPVGALTLWAPPLAQAQTPAVDPAAVQKLAAHEPSSSTALQQLQRATRRARWRICTSPGTASTSTSRPTSTVARPDKLRAARAGGVMDQRLYYDGKTLTLYNPADKVYATEPAPPTVEKTIDFARETIGILLPAADLIYRGAYPLLLQDLKLAAVVGKVVIGGVPCEHLLFSRPGVDFQIWIAEGSRVHGRTSTRSPIPARLRC